MTSGFQPQGAFAMPHRNKGQHGLDLSVVVPLFNERGTFDELHRRLTAMMLVLGLDSEIIYVDDGSTDGTREALAAAAGRDPRVHVINLARNYGQTAAQIGRASCRERV